MRQVLEEIVKEWQNWKLPEIKPREVDLSTYFDKKIKKIISVIGFRRVGKTFLLFDLAKKIGQQNCLYLNLEDERLPKKTEVLTHFIELVKELTNNQKLVLLIDEIQNIPDWSRWARRVNETSDYFLVITGSSSKLSSFEIPTQLRGRTISVKLNPLNFPEFLNFKEEKIDSIIKSKQLNLLRQYLTFGGLPEIVLTEMGKKHLIIEEYFQTFLTRDIFERYGLRQKEAFRALIRILLNSSYLTISKLTNTLKSLQFKIGKSTVSSYLRYLEDSFFLNLLEVYTPSVKERFKCPKKNYFVDNFFISKFSTTFSQNSGRLMENLVGQELIKKTITDSNFSVYYWKDYAQKEVDFVVMKNFKVKQLIQVSYVSTVEEIDEREIKSLLRASQQLKCDDCLLITWGLNKTIEQKGKKIRCVPLLDWLWQF